MTHPKGESSVSHTTREKDRFAGETCMFLQLFQKKFRQVCHSQTTPFRIVVPLHLTTRESGSDLSPGTN